MNICIVAQRYPYKDNMEFVFVKKLVDEWAKIGHRCIVVTTFPIQVYLRKNIHYKPVFYKDEVAPNITVDVYNPRTFNVPGLEAVNKIWKRYNDVNTFERLLDGLNIKFDFIYCHFFDSSQKAFIYAKEHNIPFFVATGESSIPTFRIPDSKFTLSEYRELTSGVIAVSSKNKKEAVDNRLIDESKCKVFPNSTDLTIFKRLDKSECRKKLGFSDNDFIIISVGYFCKRKGQDRVLKAIGKLNNTKIKAVFVGKSAASGGLSLEDDCIIFKGSVLNKQLPEYLCAADVFCLPTQHEGCCNAVIEAMACGCSIISSDRPFNHDVLNSANSILVDPDNIDEIADAIHTIYDNKDFREKLANKAYQDARSLGIHQRAQYILNFIESKL